MLQIGALFLELVVVVLQDLDQLLVVLDALLVEQLDVLQLDTVVVRNVGHAPQLPILCREVINEIGESVDLAHQGGDLLVLLFFLLTEELNSLDGLLDLLVSAVEGQVFVQTGDLLEQLLLVSLQVLVLVVEGLDTALERLVL